VLTYHSHVHGLARDVAGSASRILVLLSRWIAAREEPDPGTFESTKPELLAKLELLKKSSTELLEALPDDLDADEPRGHMKRHVYWLEYWIQRDKPASCLHDPADILDTDLPGIMGAFDHWYDSTAAPHPELASRLRRHIQSGDLASAAREGFAVWKTRVVEMFGLPDDIDGSRLAKRLFDESGAAAGVLSDKERIACNDLYVSLYTLVRNPASHGDVNLDRQLSEGGLTLLAWLLAKLENAHLENRHRRPSRGAGARG